MALCHNGISKNVVSKITDCSKEILNRWSQRNTIDDNQRSGRTAVYNEAMQLTTTTLYCQTTPLPDCGQWTLRMLGKYIENDPTLMGCQRHILQFIVSYNNKL